MITSPEQVTPEWLTNVLRRAGALHDGGVGGIHTRSFDTITAKAIPLSVRYTEDATGLCPTRLFLKLGRRKSEVDFHLYLAKQTHNIPTVRCYDAYFEDSIGASHLLFDDISDTHSEHPNVIPPKLATLERLVSTIAALHRHWWEHPDLSVDSKYSDLLDDVPGFVIQQAANNYADFVDMLGDRLSDKRRNYYERIFSALPLTAWVVRLNTHRAVTLVHGDTHWWNFAYPKERGDILLLDWAVWHLNFGPSDLAYTLTLNCFPEHRERIERQLVQRYHEQLAIPDYDWEQCWQDYRMSVVFHAIWPVFWTKGLSPDIWWPSFERVLCAFEDLNCLEFV